MRCVIKRLLFLKKSDPYPMCHQMGLDMRKPDFVACIQQRCFSLVGKYLNDFDISTSLYAV